jgi:hypothetical protein
MKNRQISALRQINDERKVTSDEQKKNTRYSLAVCSRQYDEESRKAGKVNNAFFLLSCIPYYLRLRLVIHGVLLHYLIRLEYGLSSSTHHSSLFTYHFLLMSSAHGVRWVKQYGFISFPRPWDRSHSLAWKPTAKESARMEFRWMAAIAIWTILSGPIFNGKGGLYAPTPDRVTANAAKPTPALQPPPGQIRPRGQVSR